MIPYGRQEITQNDIDAVLEVLGSDFLTQGPKVPLFEKEVSIKVGAKHGVAVNSATSALHLACLALGLSSGDWLWTSPISFVASANCGLYCGAKIDFVDIDPKTNNMCPYALEKKLLVAEREGKLPKIVVPVHLAGNSANMQAIGNLAKRFNFKIIEDASHAIGGKYQNRYIGNCEYSDIAVFSFHPVKIVTTAEGGMAVTNCDDLFQKMSLLRTHGVTRDQKMMTKEAEGPWYYQQIELGLNYRMTDILAALGCSQLQRLDEIISKRNSLAQIYDRELLCLPLELPYQEIGNHSSYHLYIVKLDLNQCDKTRSEVFKYLQANDIGVNVHYIPIHLQPFYQQFGFAEGDFPRAEEYYKSAISLPMFPTLEPHEQSKVISTLKELLLEPIS